MTPCRRIRNQPCKFKIGDRIRPINMFDRHDYRRDETYEVVQIDHNDSTLRARDETGAVGRWIRWQDCDASDDIGWDWLSTQLDADSPDLLSAFDGLRNLRMRLPVESRSIMGIPNLAEAIRNKLPDVEESLLIRQQSTPPDDHGGMASEAR